MTDAAQSREPWHFDRRIPLALILSILLQTAGAFWWAASMSERLSVAERAITTITTREAETNRAAQSVAERLVRIETILERMDRNLRGGANP